MATEDNSGGADRVVLKIHSNFVSSPLELARVLRAQCGAGNFKAEMRHNVYTIHFNNPKLNVLDLERLFFQYGEGRLSDD